MYEIYLSNQKETNTCMKKQKKVSEYRLNQINKGVLLSVPKLITVGEGIPTLMTSLGCSHDIISGGTLKIKR